MNKPEVLIIMGSISDKNIMKNTWNTLKELGINYEVFVSSAHRTPNQMREIVENAVSKGVEVIIAGAGASAHLPGVIAAEVIIPVIGVPIDSSPLKGIDSLFSIVQMPPGIPVSTVGVGSMGAKNAAFLAASILGLKNEKIKKTLIEKRKKMAEKVISDNKTLQDELTNEDS